MNSKICIQHDGQDVTDKELLGKFKELWKQSGGKIKEIKKLNLYFVPSSKKCYWTVNATTREESGEFEV
ncbi:DUF6465 family protein [Clostridium ganghwense]|uniref:DUF6465 family protein n=1 Tax=Clostridium ganghwense TaxID=312089 RepID=A0ABT4CQS3_9CLOT|nr:DUF6465 family protein [Clostridium ganghwense]MCY6371397.1 DUF6465 family protein [Clostridium ganghwense]